LTDGEAAWHDINVRGRKLAAVIKRCNTQFYNLMETKEYDLALAFLDRLIKSEHAIRPYVETYNGVTKFMSKKRKLENTVQVPY